MCRGGTPRARRDATLQQRNAGGQARQLCRNFAQLLLGAHGSDVRVARKVHLERAVRGRREALAHGAQRGARASGEQECGGKRRRRQLQAAAEEAERLRQHADLLRLHVGAHAQSAAHQQPPQRAQAVLAEPLDCRCGARHSRRARVGAHRAQKRGGGHRVHDPAADMRRHAVQDVRQEVLCARSSAAGVRVTTLGLGRLARASGAWGARATRLTPCSASRAAETPPAGCRAVTSSQRSRQRRAPGPLVTSTAPSRPLRWSP